MKSILSLIALTLLLPLASKADSTACKGIAVYPDVYKQESLESTRMAMKAFPYMGVKVARIENGYYAALNRGIIPTRVPKNGFSLTVFDESATACANELANYVKRYYLVNHDLEIDVRVKPKNQRVPERKNTIWLQSTIDPEYRWE